MRPMIVGGLIVALATSCAESFRAHVRTIRGPSSSSGDERDTTISDRRDFLKVSTSFGLCGLLLPSTASAVTSSESTLRRFDTDNLMLPAPSYSSEFNGVDNTYYPPFLAGEWEVTQTLVDTKTPLGLKYVGGPNADIDIAQRSINESKSKLNVPVTFSLRYLTTKWGVAEDRLFNVQQRLDAFAGKKVVASVQYADVGGSNRQSVVNLGGSKDDPLQTTLVYFKGPAAQKAFLVSHGGGLVNPTLWSGYELQRSIFALTNQSTAPPITTDTELIWELEQIDDVTVRGKLRIAEYLNAQRDKLYFDARNRAVFIQDYTLDMKRKD